MAIVKISVQVHPGAKRNEVLRFEAGVWHIKVAAPPVEGKANEALIKFLSKALDVPKSRISLEKGATSRHKIIAIEGLSEEQIRSLLLPS
jgi:uncharacterized protein